MLKLAPPVWALIYIVIAALVSAIYPWRALIGLRVLSLGILLVAGGLVIAFLAATLFARKGTEINPISKK
jgi:hypothetical protein